MELKYLFVICVVFAAGVSIQGASAATTSKCNIPPQFWCDTVHVSRMCGVLDQCLHYAVRSFNKPLRLDVFYESMCPDCNMFFADQLFPVFSSLVDIVDINLVPYGNALEKWDKDTRRYNFTCQHGDEECYGNIVSTCTMHVLDYDIQRYFPMIHCMETSPDHPKEAAEGCGKQFNISMTPVLECTESKLGNQLQHKMAQKTNLLDPTHTYVPWVSVNGVHTDRIQQLVMNDLSHFLCDNFVGPSKPDACNNLSYKLDNKQLRLL